MDEQKNKLYVGNLPYSSTSESLKELFSKIGEVIDAVVISDKFLAAQRVLALLSSTMMPMLIKRSTCGMARTSVDGI